MIKEIQRVSTPGRRVYSSIQELKPRYCNGLGISILSTPKGVMSDALLGSKTWAAKFCARCSKDKRAQIRNGNDVANW